MGLFRRKPKTCEMCEHYSIYRTEDEINDDKTITPGEVKMVACGLWNMELKDTNPCGKWERPWESTRMIKFRSAPAFSLYLAKEMERIGPPPIPPREQVQE